MRNRLQAAMHSTREAIQQGDAELAEQCGKELEELLREAGVALYAQSPQAPKTGPYAPHPYPDTSGAGVGEKPSGSGERGRVVDADYEESN
jgi:molecular chaperone DnaK